MNGYERIVAALELREPDQVPLMEWSTDSLTWIRAQPGYPEVPGSGNNRDLNDLARYYEGQEA